MVMEGWGGVLVSTGWQYAVSYYNCQALFERVVEDRR